MIRIAVIAGEESGDSRAAALMRELSALRPDIQFFGVGGPRMAALPQTNPNRFDCWIDRAGVVGLWDVLRNYSWFRKKFAQLGSMILREQPDALLFVDYPGFNLRMAKTLRSALPQIPFIYYISPQVWAWNRGRIPQMARILDLMLCIFPFEEPLYSGSGLRTVFVGHPLVEELAAEANAGEAPGKLHDDKIRQEHLVGFFPGSREREVRKLFPAYLGAMRHIRASRPDLAFSVAAARESHAQWMRAEASRANVNCEITVGQAHHLMRTAAAGIVCSGTATLEAALLGLPYALAYKVPWLTYEIGRRVIRVPYLGIVNILAGREIVREFIQHNCSPLLLADEILRLMNNSQARSQLSQALAEATSILGGPGASRHAAAAILEALREK